MEDRDGGRGSAQRRSPEPWGQLESKMKTDARMEPEIFSSHPKVFPNVFFLVYFDPTFFLNWSAIAFQCCIHLCCTMQ